MAVVVSVQKCLQLLIPSPVRSGQPLRPGVTCCTWCGCRGRVSYCICRRLFADPAAAWGRHESLLFGGGFSCCLRYGLSEDGQGAGLLAYSVHSLNVVSPDTAVIKPLKPEIARMHWLVGADVISEPSHERAKRAAMAEPTPTSSPVCFVSENPPVAVIVDEPDLAALIDFHAGVTVCLLVKEEAPAVITNDSNHLVNKLCALQCQGVLAFFSHELA